MSADVFVRTEHLVRTYTSSVEPVHAVNGVSIQIPRGRLTAVVRCQRVRQALEWVGLAKRTHHRPHELSGGEQQRVAIARAQAARRRIILADEPTGQLDSQIGSRVLETMQRFAEQLGITLIIVTHDPMIMQAADVSYEMHDGRIIDRREPMPA